MSAPPVFHRGHVLRRLANAALREARLRQQLAEERREVKRLRARLETYDRDFDALLRSTR